MTATAGVRLITLDEVIDRIPYSKVHIYRLMEQGKFPRSVAVGAQRIAFVEKEIDDWIASRMRDRDDNIFSDDAAVRKALAIRAAKARHHQTI
jgi:prophage regulatory protein